MSNTTDPSGISYFFNIQSESEVYDAFLDVNDFEDFSNFDLRYRRKEDVKWTFLTGVELRAENMKTKEATDAEIDRTLAKLNEKIEEVFGKGSATAPEFGIERVKWLLKNGFIEASNNELSLKK